MKIAYLAIKMTRKLAIGGVGQKMNMQVGIWQMMGHEAKIFTMISEEIPFLHWNTYYQTPFERLNFFNKIRQEILYSSKLSQLIADLKTFQPDVVLLRFHRYIFGLERIFKIAPVVIDLNTDDTVELSLVNPSLMNDLHNKLTRPIMFQNAAGFNPLSYEIANLPANTRYHLPTLVLGNGIDLNKYPPLPAPNNTHPHFAMVSSDKLQWHGVDKMIGFFKQYPDLHLDLVGYGQEDFPEVLPNNVQAHGFLPHEQVANILARADVVFGTMALHRKKMNEASPLKVREGLAHGIPLVIAYEDTDLEGVELDTILRIPNSEKNMETHAEAIRDFAYRMRGRRIPREILIGRIDWQSKETKRLDFFNEIILGST